MKYFDAFTGIGGFTLALHNAIQNNQPETKQLQAKQNLRGDNGDELQRTTTCVGFSEIDKHAAAIYQHHYPNHKNYGDITKLDAAILPDFDLFMGGFPCQSFSIAGKRRGFSDTRGTLFFEVARILRDKKPKYFLLENVKGLLSHDGGRTFSTIIEVLQEIGYGVSWKVLNTKDFGIPQNRERVFIFGVRGECPREILPVGESDTDANQTRCNEKCFTAIDANYFKGVGVRGSKCRACVDESRSHILSRPHGFNSGGKKEMPCVRACNNFSANEPVIHNSKIRRLTPTECERLQGFPDGWTSKGKYGEEIKDVSDTQRYKTLGNAVTVKVVQSIFESIFRERLERLLKNK